MISIQLLPFNLIALVFHSFNNYQLQVLSEFDVKQAIKTAVDKCGPLRISVNTAGIMGIAKTLSEAGEVHPLQMFEEITKV